LTTSAIPGTLTIGFSDVTESEFTIYVDRLAPQTLIVAVGLWNEANVDAFSSSVADRLPQLCVIAQHTRMLYVIVQMQKEVIPCTIYGSWSHVRRLRCLKVYLSDGSVVRRPTSLKVQLSEMVDMIALGRVG